MLVDYYFKSISLQPKNSPLGLVRGDYSMYFLSANFSILRVICKLENKHEFSFCFFVTKHPFFTGTDRILTYQRLTGFVVSFAYLWFLDTRLSMGPSLFLIHLVLRYKVTSGSIFYQIWFLDLRIIIDFVRGCLTTWSRGSH
jgi:hypothetical protein